MVEVGLKALALSESGKVAKGHDLKTLFGTLSPALQAQIVAETGDAAFTKRFDSGLDLVRDTFDVWRYIYEEHSVDTDLGFLQRFAAAVQKALKAIP